MNGTVVGLLLRLLALLPLRLNHGVGRLMSKLYLWIPNRRRTVGKTNIGLCYPERDEKWRRALLRECLTETSKAFTELGPLWYWDEKRLMELVPQVSGGEILEHARAKGAGLIILLPHSGSWEMANLYLSRHLHLTTLFRPPEMQALHGVMHFGRERMGARLVPTDVSGVRELYRVLRAGEAIAMLPDQEPPRGSGAFAPFFGVPAYTMRLISRLARKTGAPVVTVMAERLAAGKGYKLHCLPVSDAIYDADPVISATATNEAVQTCININPRQYLWTYKRFRHRPPTDWRVQHNAL
ncbi:MAG: lysophospholipid acyltransferase family protein [Acidiferrobacterales bacterium]